MAAFDLYLSGLWTPDIMSMPFYEAAAFLAMFKEYTIRKGLSIIKKEP